MLLKQRHSLWNEAPRFYSLFKFKSLYFSITMDLNHRARKGHSSSLLLKLLAKLSHFVTSEKKKIKVQEEPLSSTQAKVSAAKYKLAGQQDTLLCSSLGSQGTRTPIFYFLDECCSHWATV